MHSSSEASASFRRFRVTGTAARATGVDHGGCTLVVSVGFWLNFFPPFDIQNVGACASGVSKENVFGRPFAKKLVCL